jgi:hypothetical protein
MDELMHLIRGHPPPHDAADVALIPVDQFGKPIGLTLSDPADKLALMARGPAKG